MNQFVRALKRFFRLGVHIEARVESREDTIAAPKSQLIIRKARFIKPELIPHGNLVDVTAPFGGTLTPSAANQALHQEMLRRVLPPGPTGPLGTL
jgi:hypothetical protein